MKRRLNKKGIIFYLVTYIIIITLLDIIAKYSITHNTHLTEVHVLVINTITLFSKIFTIEVYKMLKAYRFN